MDAIGATWKDGRIAPDGPVDWPEGCRLRIEPEPAQAETSGWCEEGWSDSPEAIVDWLAWYDSLEPLIFTPEEKAELGDWRRQVKEYTIANMAEGIEDLFE
jgi:hypothetical protein